MWKFSSFPPGLSAASSCDANTRPSATEISCVRTNMLINAQRPWHDNFPAPSAFPSASASGAAAASHIDGALNPFFVWHSENNKRVSWFCSCQCPGCLEDELQQANWSAAQIRGTLHHHQLVHCNARWAGCTLSVNLSGCKEAAFHLCLGSKTQTGMVWVRQAHLHVTIPFPRHVKSRPLYFWNLLAHDSQCTGRV